MSLDTIPTHLPGRRSIVPAGEVSGWCTFFIALGYRARSLLPLFVSPMAWRWLEAGITVVMWSIAATLIPFT